MGIYARHVLPRLINLAMRNKAATAERARLVPLASGTVLEVGIGSGLNIPLYPPDLKRLYGLDPSPELWRLAQKRVSRAPFPIGFVESSAERIPLADRAVDTVVTTWTLCTIPDPVSALKEMRRVLKAEGQLIFIEHGRSPDGRVLAWQERLTPLWKRIAGGCNLDREIDALIAGAGFRITQIERAYSRGPKPFAYLYKGLARPS